MRWQSIGECGRPRDAYPFPVSSASPKVSFCRSLPSAASVSLSPVAVPDSGLLRSGKEAEGKPSCVAGSRGRRRTCSGQEAAEASILHWNNDSVKTVEGAAVKQRAAARASRCGQGYQGISNAGARVLGTTHFRSSRHSHWSLVWPGELSAVVLIHGVRSPGRVAHDGESGDR
eukprot:scaffold7760_cov286-Pinguiococcus_pyrenoidosus.AAC.2